MLSERPDPVLARDERFRTRTQAWSPYRCGDTAPTQGSKKPGRGRRRTQSEKPMTHQSSTAHAHYKWLPATMHRIC
jgi:hypothetical protein